VNVDLLPVGMIVLGVVFLRLRSGDTPITA
jgi:hypothetical protein